MERNPEYNMKARKKRPPFGKRKQAQGSTAPGFLMVRLGANPDPKSKEPTHSTRLNHPSEFIGDIQWDIHPQGTVCSHPGAIGSLGRTGAGSKAKRTRLCLTPCHHKLCSCPHPLFSIIYFEHLDQQFAREKKIEGGTELSEGEREALERMVRSLIKDGQRDDRTRRSSWEAT